MKPIFYFLSFVLLVTLFVSCGKAPQTSFEKDQELAARKAKQLYTQLKEQEMDFSSGPCISNEIIQGWVADIAHSPRQEADNKPENQCSAYRDGLATHFIELDPEGNFIRAL